MANLPRPVLNIRYTCMVVIRLPHPPLEAALPFLCLAAEPSPIPKRTLVLLNYHTYVKKQAENLYGWGTITCKTTITKPRVYNRVKTTGVVRLMLVKNCGTQELKKHPYSDIRGLSSSCLWFVSPWDGPVWLADGFMSKPFA